MTEQPKFKSEDVKRARFLYEFIQETETAIKNLEIPRKTFEYEKLVFLRRLLDNPRCSRKRRDDVDELIRQTNIELDNLKDQSRSYNNELEVFTKMFAGLPDELQQIASSTPFNGL
ncbi:hypothetical protein JXQ70_10765 [bacterium]|nr:hypothetical protein [bacterium]